MPLQPAADDLLTCLLTVARSLYTMELASPRPSRGLPGSEKTSVRAGPDSHRLQAPWRLGLCHNVVAVYSKQSTLPVKLGLAERGWREHLPPRSCRHPTPECARLLQYIYMRTVSRPSTHNHLHAELGEPCPAGYRWQPTPAIVDGIDSMHATSTIVTIKVTQRDAASCKMTCVWSRPPHSRPAHSIHPRRADTRPCLQKPMPRLPSSDSTGESSPPYSTSLKAAINRLHQQTPEAQTSLRHPPEQSITNTSHLPRPPTSGGGAAGGAPQQHRLHSPSPTINDRPHVRGSWEPGVCVLCMCGRGEG
jgi:hypothetical protein